MNIYSSFALANADNHASVLFTISNVPKVPTSVVLCGSPLAQLLNLRVRQRDVALQRRIGTMAEELQTRNVSAETVAGLEKLARLLDLERVELRAKLSET